MRFFRSLCLVLLLGACADGTAVNPEVTPTDCGLIEVDPAADPGRIPSPLLLEDQVTVATTQMKQGRVLAALNVRLSVDDSFVAYKKALAEAEIEILQEDNEGFEAELYVGNGKQLGSVVIRRSVCEDAVVVYLNLPARWRGSP